MNNNENKKAHVYESEGGDAGCASQEPCATLHAMSPYPLSVMVLVVRNSSSPLVLPNRP